MISPHNAATATFSEQIPPPSLPPVKESMFDILTQDVIDEALIPALRDVDALLPWSQTCKPAREAVLRPMLRQDLAAIRAYAENVAPKSAEGQNPPLKQSITALAPPAPALPAEAACAFFRIHRLLPPLPSDADPKAPWPNESCRLLDTVTVLENYAEVAISGSLLGHPPLERLPCRKLAGAMQAVERKLMEALDAWVKQWQPQGMAVHTARAKMIDALVSKTRQLNLSGSRFALLPPLELYLPFLEFLDISNSAVQVLPKELGQLTGLRGLNVSNNERLHHLPKEIGNLMHLEVLVAHDTGLRRLNPAIRGLVSLRVLDLNGHHFNEWPVVLKRLTWLEQLQMSSSWQMRMFRDVASLTSIRKLELENLQLDAAPRGIEYLQKMTHLFLGFNQLTRLPWGFCGLESLTCLRLNDNHLSSLPEDFGLLENLRYLTLEGNALEKLPESFVDLRNLEDLNLRRNPLVWLPRRLSRLLSLKKLDVSYTAMWWIPGEVAEIGPLSHLLCYASMPMEISPKVRQKSGLRIER